MKLFVVLFARKDLTSFVGAIFAALLVGCSTTYNANSFWNDGGYDEVQIDSNAWRVSFHGNEFTDKERATNFCLLRCAEICLQNGYSYFVIVSQDSSEKNTSYTTPTFTTPTYSTTNIIGNTAYTNTYGAQTFGGQTYHSSKPSTSNEIVCFKTKPKGTAYNAEFLLRSMKVKYGIE